MHFLRSTFHGYFTNACNAKLWSNIKIINSQELSNNHNSNDVKNQSDISWFQQPIRYLDNEIAK